MTTGRHIALGVSGSIAAYKAVYLARLLVDDGLEVWPLVTRAAARFVGPLSFSVVCGRGAITDLWAAAEAGEVGHVELAHRIELMLIAPCTADVIARLAAGRATDPLTAVALATRAPVWIAPAMETGMWEHPVTQESLAVLRARGVGVIPPEPGALASGRSGVGRMAEPETVRQAVLAALTPKDLQGLRVLVTAGPTREPFDPVRFVSNASSGKMGYAVARQAARRGASVTLVSGPVQLDAPPGVERVMVETTEEMLATCQTHLEPGCDLWVMAAAPADYRPVQRAGRKVKKGERLGLELETTADILATLGPRAGRAVVVGFAAETHEVLAHARKKLDAKGLDLIVANDVTRADAGFGTDTNVVTLVGKDGADEALPLLSKDEVARVVLDRALALVQERRGSAPRAAAPRQRR